MQLFLVPDVREQLEWYSASEGEEARAEDTHSMGSTAPFLTGCSDQGCSGDWQGPPTVSEEVG